jgi:GrpB-like predicted nucleotidyltransferase (UPF0157 family)
MDHIGSTAVPGLSAKPIIDVQVSVTDFSHTRELIPSLESSGFVHRPEADNDRPPPWDTLDPAQWEKEYFRTPTGVEPRVHIHVREVGRRNHRYALLFRDYLRESERVRDSYGLYKSLLSENVAEESGPGGTGLYLDLKDPILDLIANAAEQWATEVGWTPRVGNTSVA